MRICHVHALGRLPYGEAHELQRRLVEQRKREEIPDTLLLLEHPHVITLGRAAEWGNVLVPPERRAELGVELHETGRGGDVTYHGPGQLVGYPILNLSPDRCDIRRYVRDLQEVIIRSVAHFGVEAGRHDEQNPHVGVWVNGEKLAALGIRVSRWVTMHGFALNVTTNLDYFRLIVPCGIRDHGVTSLERLLGRPVDPAVVIDQVVSHFGDVFGRQMERCDIPSGASLSEPLPVSDSRQPAPHSPVRP
ncbi:MAG: lipoyl(octanoyl) transferase LipB [Blastocatellia bacterium]